MKIPKPKKRSISKLKKELDKTFSQYIRQKYADDKGVTSCFTCGVQKPWTEMQNGHFVSRQYLATRFDERNVRPQCIGCNIFGNGKTSQFATKLEAELGVGITMELYREAQKITKDFPYEEKIKEYKSKIK